MQECLVRRLITIEQQLFSYIPVGRSLNDWQILLLIFFYFLANILEVIENY